MKKKIRDVLCDLAKAFDCVSDTVILGKLFCYGIHGLNTQ